MTITPNNRPNPQSGQLTHTNVRRQPQQAQPPVPSGVQPQQTNLPGIKGKLPHRPGKVILTEREQRELQAVGWKPGEPLPPNLAKVLREEQARVQTEIETTTPDDPGFTPPKIQDISTLPLEQQAEIRKSIEQFKTNMQAMAEQREQEDELSQLPPSIQEAVRTAMQPGFEVIDTRSDEDHKRLGTQPIQQIHKVIRLEDLAQQIQQKVQQSDAKQIEQPEAPQNTQGDVIRNCPHCNWPLDQKDNVNPTNEDKIQYVSAVLGGREFIKEYVFFGGTMKVAYRSLLAEQSDMAFNQIRFDQLEHQMPFMEAMWRLMNYRMVCSLVRIVTPEGIINVARIVDDFFSGKPCEEAKSNLTPLPYLVQQLRQHKVLANESVWRILRENYKRFNDLVEHLEAHSDDANFWTPSQG